MDDHAKEQLLRIVTRHGLDVALDRRRCEGLLRDYCPENKREIAALLLALAADVPSQLVQPGLAGGIELVHARVTKKLLKETPLAEDAAKWTVAAWTYALTTSCVDQQTWVRKAPLLPAATVSVQHPHEANYLARGIVAGQYPDFDRLGTLGASSERWQATIQLAIGSMKARFEAKAFTSLLPSHVEWEDDTVESVVDRAWHRGREINSFTRGFALGSTDATHLSATIQGHLHRLTGWLTRLGGLAARAAAAGQLDFSCEHLHRHLDRLEVRSEHRILAVEAAAAGLQRNVQSGVARLTSAEVSDSGQQRQIQEPPRSKRQFLMEVKSAISLAMKNVRRRNDLADARSDIYLDRDEIALCSDGDHELDELRGVLYKALEKHNVPLDALACRPVEVTKEGSFLQTIELEPPGWDIDRAKV